MSLILLLIVWIIIMIISVRPSQKGYELVSGIECDEDLHDDIPLCSRLGLVERPPEQRKYKYPSLCLQASQNR